MKTIFPQKYLSWANAPFLDPKMGLPHTSGLALRVFFNFQQQMGLIVHGRYTNGLSEKILVWGKWVI